MYCRLTGERCGISRAVVMLPNCEMQSNVSLVNGDGLVAAASM